MTDDDVIGVTSHYDVITRCSRQLQQITLYVTVIFCLQPIITVNRAGTVTGVTSHYDVNQSSSTADAATVSAARRGLHGVADGDGGDGGVKLMACRGLRSKRYISDGFCRTLRPITEMLCTGQCVRGDARLQPVSGMARWRCLDGQVVSQRVRLICDNGSSKSYRLRVVKSCTCVRRRRHRRRFTRRRASSSSSVM